MHIYTPVRKTHLEGGWVHHKGGYWAQVELGWENGPISGQSGVPKTVLNCQYNMLSV